MSIGEAMMDTARAQARPTVEGGLVSVLAALDVLDSFATHDELGVSELARRIGVAKSTAHRLLTTLCARGLAERDEQTGRYRLGMRLYELGQLALDRNEMRTRALPVLRELQHVSGGTIHFAVPDGSDVVYLERLVHISSIRSFAHVGRRLPSHCTSSGKVIAAFTAAARVRAGFTPLTTHSIHSERQYALALAQVRRQGFAVNADEALAGFASVAAPVLGHDGSAKAAISIVGPSDRLLNGIGRPAQLVQMAARRLSRELCL